MESILKYTEITKKSPKKQTHQNPKTLNDDKGKKKKTPTQNREESSSPFQLSFFPSNFFLPLH